MLEKYKKAANTSGKKHRRFERLFGRYLRGRKEGSTLFGMKLRTSLIALKY
jgi:hypothetical protein